MSDKIAEILNEMREMSFNASFYEEHIVKGTPIEKVDKIKTIINDFFETKYDTDEIFYCFYYLKKLFDNFKRVDIIFFKTFFNYYKNSCTNKQLLNALKSYLTEIENISVHEMKKGDLIFENRCRIVEVDKIRKVKNNNWTATGYDVKSGLKHSLVLSWLMRYKITSYEFDDIKDIDVRFIKPASFIVFAE